jgi:hypothetical protein
MGKLIAPIGILIGAAVWFLLFVIIGVTLGTAFIAGGCAAAAVAVAAGMAAYGGILDPPLTASGLLLGTATFLILEVVLSVPLWVDIVSGLGVMGLHGIFRAVLRPAAVAATDEERPGVGRRFGPTPSASNGHNREPIAAR